MKNISYKFSPEGSGQNAKEKQIVCKDNVFEENLAAAKAEAYNGDVSVEDIPDEDTDRIPTPEQSAMLMMRAMFSQQASGLEDDTIIRYSGLADEWQPGDHKNGDIYNADNQTWECYQDYNNDVYPDIQPGAAAWYTFNRPLHGKSKETARPFVPVQGAHDMYRSGEYTIFTDGKTYRCKSDTAYSPTDYPDAWEVAS